jgi:prepilin-type processing-associated H-X9-DG protein
VRCPHCGYRLGAKCPQAGELVPCPRCRSDVIGEGLPSVGIEPLPPKRGTPRFFGYVPPALKIGGVLLVGLLVIACLLPAGSHARPAANRMSCGNSLKQIALALHNYHDTYKALPAQSITDGNGRPMHSWRTALLPFVEEGALYEAYDFDQPWDSPHNREVCSKPIGIYLCPSSAGTKNSNLTNYFVVYGDETMFAPDRWIKFSDVTDGLSNTIMVVECDSVAMRVEWAEPRDIPFDRMTFRINAPEGVGISSEHSDGAQVAFGDGHVQYLSEDAVAEATLRYLLIRNDGKNVQIP